MSVTPSLYRLTISHSFIRVPLNLADGLMKIENCLLLNVTLSYQPAIRASGIATFLELKNNTIVDYAPGVVIFSSAQLDVGIRNNIVIVPGSGVSIQYDAALSNLDVTTMFNLLSDGFMSGQSGNLAGDPAFRDAGNGDYRLGAGSAALDKGYPGDDSSLEPCPGRIDMGAFGNTPDAGSPDCDSDGIPNEIDNCSAKPNADQADADGDGRGNVCDNCIEVANNTGQGAQCDSDGDGYGNACDGDFVSPAPGNGFTNTQDYLWLRGELYKPSVPPLYHPADINCNGFVSPQDYVLWKKLINQPPGPSGLVP